MSGIIDVSELKEERIIEWKIPQFFQSSQSVEHFESVLSLFQKQWMIMIYPRGIDGHTPEYVILGVILLHPSSDFTVDIEFDVKGRLRIQTSTQETGGGTGFRMWTWRCKSANLQKLLHDDVLSGRIIVSCNEEIANPTNSADAACQTTFVCNDDYFCRDFQDLLLSNRKSDASIEVQGRLFNVHKLILEACSPVFSAMFDHDISEKNEGIVKVDDCDPDTFQNFLKCLYSGKLENIPPKNLMALYKVSDKYCVPDLKEKCSEYMVKELSESNVCEVLAVADMCNDVQLKVSAEVFLVKNVKTILRTKTWKTFQSKNPSLAAEILTKVVQE